MSAAPRFVFFGTPDFAERVLDELERSGLAPAAVVCQPDRPRGRGRRPEPPPVKRWAAARGIELLQPARQREPAYLERFRAIRPELALVAAFGQLLPRPVLEVPRLGFVNVHPSLVPRHRGAAPIQWSLISGDRQTGVSILEMTPRLDDGPVLAREVVAIDPHENAVELGARLARIGGRLAAEVIVRRSDEPFAGEAQDESQVTWAPQLERADGRLDWTQPAAALHDRIRGVQPWPGASCGLRGARLKIHRAAPLDEPDRPGAGPGEVVAADPRGLWVQTGAGVLALLEVQAAGRKRMPARAFVAGRQVAPGDRLGG